MTSSFADLGVPDALCAALAAGGVHAPFPIQTATLPHSLAGRDVLGRARTGSGKTYAFVLPVMARLSSSPARRRPGRPRALVLVPTRELALQIDAAMAPLASAMGLRTLTVFGGVGHNPQISALRGGVDIVVACPGRMEDHIRAGHAVLDAVEITVLDEADHMADLGFLPAVSRLLALTPRTGQRLLFSATLDAGVDVLVRRFLTDPVTHSVDSAQSPVSAMSHHVLHVRTETRLPVLLDLVAAPGTTLVFTRTKHRAKTLTRQLVASGVPAVELHGNLGQNARTRNLTAFANGTARTLVATDIAARGIHVDDVARVIHADPPIEHKAYLHRSGRTARAGAQGTVITLMTDDQVSDVRDLTRKAGIKPTITRLGPDHPLLAELAPGERSFASAPALRALNAETDAVAGSSAGRSRSGGRGSNGSAGGRGSGASAGGRGSGDGAGRSGRGSGGSGGAARGSGGGRGSAGSSGADGGTRGGSGRGSAGGPGGSRRRAAAPSTQRIGDSAAAASTPQSRTGGAAAFSSGTRAGTRRTR